MAVALRLGAGLARGPAFVDEGYSFYADLAHTFWDGNGLCYAPGEGCAVRMPLYPILVAPFLAAGTAYPWLIVSKALIGATQPLIAFGIARQLFNPRIALAAAAGAALNPYAVIHGPSFQETVVFNALISVSIFLLIKAVRQRDLGMSAAAGLALALAMLTTVRMILFVPIALAWLAGSNAERPRLRVARVALAALPIVALLGGWAARNAALVGAPVLTTEFGLSLWLATHESTMAFLPAQSIDRVTPMAWQGLPEEVRQTAHSLGGDPAAQNRLFTSLALSTIAADPGRVLVDAVRKITLSFTGILSPAREWPIELAYTAVFFPLNLLALIGLWRVRREGGGHLLVILLFVTFAVTTGVFWAHTSHRSFLHVFKTIYAASVVTPVVMAMWERYAGKSTSA